MMKSDAQGSAPEHETTRPIIDAMVGRLQYLGVETAPWGKETRTILWQVWRAALKAAYVPLPVVRGEAVPTVEAMLTEILEAHRRFHRKVGCPGDDCYVCQAEDRYGVELRGSGVAARIDAQLNRIEVKLENALAARYWPDTLAQVHAALEILRAVRGEDSVAAPEETKHE